VVLKLVKNKELIYKQTAQTIN